ncbi:unnamed protein product [Cylicocyclus nassatus]|uniref:Major facilitator superfamily (MFS) profile domain-containing protein n=1 Tax=Cylicocyclus nassatus TaxID=53992 RepID=A0AA36MFR3_CYLNA|nr:unnamed protein product [Cylicocyclus nassatus]
MVEVFSCDVAASGDDDHYTPFGTRTRFVVLVLVLLCLTSVWSNILTFNFALICMAQESTANGTNVLQSIDTKFTTQESWAISVVAIAALIGNFPVVSIVNKVGIRTVFAGLGLLSAISTLMIPSTIRAGFYYFLLARFLQGIAFAANFPVIGSFCSKWSYFKQSGLFVSCLVAYVQLAPALTMPASGALCTAFKWPSIFYAHGAVSLFLFLTYGIFYRNSPGKHPFVGNVELRKISIGKASNVDKKALQAIPYKAILTTPAIWAVWISSVGNFTAVNMMFLFSPKYLSTVLGFAVHKTGLTSAIPPFAQFAGKLICGAVSDRIHFLSEKNKYRLFNSIAFYGATVFLVILAFMGDEYKNVNMMTLGVAAGILGATTGGFFKAGPVISKQYSHFVTGNISLGITTTMLIVPFVVNFLTPNNTQDEWGYVFLFTSAVLVITNTVFCYYITGEPCEWTKDEFVRSHTSAKVADAPAGAANEQKF